MALITLYSFTGYNYTRKMRPAYSQASLRGCIFSDLILQEHSKCSGFNKLFYYNELAKWMWKNTGKLQLFLTLHSSPTPSPSNSHHPLSFTPSFMSIYLHVTMPKFAARIHWFHIRLAASWQSHGKHSTGCQRSWMLPRKRVVKTQIRSLHLELDIFRGQWGRG